MENTDVISNAITISRVVHMIISIINTAVTEEGKYEQGHQQMIQCKLCVTLFRSR